MSSASTLTTDETDKLILAACISEDGAIEDSEVTEDAVTYFFETGAIGIVSRVTGEIQITSTPRSR